MIENAPATLERPGAGHQEVSPVPESAYKRCGRCRTFKPVIEFSRASATKDGRYGYCKPCSTKANREWYLKNRPARKRQRRNYDRLKKYGLTASDYAEMLERQAGGCALCGSDGKVAHKEVLAVDHCHVTGKVRGLLCDSCNRAIGLLADDPEFLRLAALYLETHGA